ncbi:LLM class flavin-dependent oxidoreductase [Falsiroseomonas sp.]|uniref:LLM class flavin-dependent oxidoreductase n=1 Tax=Falsiroseomonas sp. TaxID=2870721 RepID=UPI003F6F1E1A
MLSLITGLHPAGNHPAGWRHPRAYTDTLMNLEQMIEIARTAERGLFDMLFISDGNGVAGMEWPELFEANALTGKPAVFEPVTVLSAIAMHTQRIGLLATATTTYEEPFTLARKFASLDHISKGRACWNVVTSSNASDSLNFGKDEHLARYDRYERAREFVEVCKGLWDSWAEDAFPQDKASGKYIDLKKVRVLNHVGKHFKVRGPLNAARPPQGYPVLFSAGQSEPGRELAAALSDCMFCATPTKQQALAFYTDMKSRLPKYGRRPDELRIMPGCVVYVGRTAAEAEEMFREQQALIDPIVGVRHLSHYVAMDLTGFDIDAPFPELTPDSAGGSSRRYAISEVARREGLTIRQTYERFLPSFGHIVMKGDGAQVADMIEDWYRAGACDGFNVHVGFQPDGLSLFVDHVVPELQRRGLFRTSYPGTTLRDVVGLGRPESQFFPRAALTPAMVAE